MWYKCLLFLLIFVFQPVVSWANTITAFSCSLTDVTQAYNSASSGDIVTIPAGNCSWSSTLTISKEITLMGAGKTSTVISNSGANPLININPGSDLSVRVSSICFDNSPRIGSSAIDINGSMQGKYELSQIRIDNCKFINGARTIHARGWVEGVIDNNEFINCEIAIGVTGCNTASWNRPIEAGTGDSLFIEDNLFYVDNDFPDAQDEPEQQIYQQEGGRSVTRYNIFDGRNYTEGNFHCYDSHGNQAYYSVNPNGIRGQPIVEIYNNEMYAYKSYRLVDFRGGSVLFYNNNLITETGTAPFIDATEEESWQSLFFKPLESTYNAEDQIMNSFFWNNKSNGNPITNIVPRMESDTKFIQKDRDYFMHAPQPSGVKAIYMSRPGGDETLSSDGSNAYYPYTPYTYPHPMRGGEEEESSPQQAPLQPQSLRIIK